MKAQLIFLSLFLKGLCMLLIIALCFLIKPPQPADTQKAQSCLTPKKGALALDTIRQADLMKI
ncbi:hypothetical protein [Spirosoma gilvum]